MQQQERSSTSQKVLAFFCEKGPPFLLSNDLSSATLVTSFFSYFCFKTTLISWKHSHSSSIWFFELIFHGHQALRHRYTGICNFRRACPVAGYTLLWIMVHVKGPADSVSTGIAEAIGACGGGKKCLLFLLFLFFFVPFLLPLPEMVLEIFL